MRRITPLGVVALGAVFAATAQAQSIDPATFTGTMAVGESITINKTITLASGGADLVDLYMLADNTGSMGGTITQAKAGASAILGALPTNTWVGVGDYQGDCSEGGYAAGCREEATTYYGFGEKAALSGDLSNSPGGAQYGINQWAALYGGDTPEANFDALKDVADLTAWRSGSQRLVVWFGDAPSHTESTTMAGAIAALNAKGVTVLAFNNYGAGTGLDGSYGGDANQASTVASSTGGSIYNNFGSLTGTDFVDAINGAIGSATSTLDLVFGTDFFSIYAGGLSFAFTCTDALGCTNVGGGESRSFDVTITALAEGTYDFTIGADGVAARESDRIIVGGTGVPEPLTSALLGIGLLGLGFVARKRREEEGRFA